MADQEGLYKELERGKVLAIEIEADSRTRCWPAPPRRSPNHGRAGQRQGRDRKEIEIVDDTTLR